MIRYSNGKIFTKNSSNIKKPTQKPRSFSHGNRGMNLEEDINISNDYYKMKGLCLITKRPTPINIVEVDYSHGATITNAYFEKQSTTDYNGVYQGKYIDFEAKSTQSKTSFPLANISKHQIEHLKNVLKQKGIAFFIIEFAKHDEFVIDYYENGNRKSIPYSEFKVSANLIKKGLNPRLDYLPIIIEKYCKN